MIDTTIDFYKRYETNYGYSEIYVVHKDSDNVPYIFEKRYINTKPGAKPQYEYNCMEYWLETNEDYNLNQLLDSWFYNVFIGEDDFWNHP